MIKVFVNGTFDVLHVGHLDLLKYARSMGDFLLVALDDDDRVRQKKGIDRPVNNQMTRARIMQDLKYVDMVQLFDTDEELTNLIRTYQPDIMIVGSDWKGKPIIGSEHAKHLIYYERNNDESTTKTLEDFITRRFMHR